MELTNLVWKNLITQHLNDEQIKVFNECINSSSSVFCTGRGGTGKSRVTESVIRYLRENDTEPKPCVAVTASTGVASFLIKGITLHRFAGVGIVEDDRDEMLNKALSSKSLDYWKNTDILIIDEISMISAQFFDNLSYVAQHIRHSQEPFGGIRLLMFGDFLQLPPVSKTSFRVPRAFESAAWKDLAPSMFNLNKIMRQQDETFTQMVSKVRIGECTDDVCEYFESLSRDIVYDDNIEPVRLYSRRNTTDEYNTSKLNKINAQPKLYTSKDKGETRLLTQCPAPKSIELKYGCQVMLIRNINDEAVNGSVGTVIGFRYSNDTKSFQPLVKFIGHESRSFTLVISPLAWETIAPNGIVVCSRVQIPLILAWAITIHKSQGQTIPRLYVDLDKVFERGQAYVALSRCVDPSSLQVINFKKEIVKVDKICAEYYNVSSEVQTTDVATTTETESWDNNTVGILRIGRLSIRGTSRSSPRDSETS